MDLVSFIEGKENNSFPEDFISSVFLSPHIQKDGVWTILYQGKKNQVYESVEPVHRMWDTKSSSLSVLTRNSSAPFKLRIIKDYILDITSILCLINTVITKAI